MKIGSLQDLLVDLVKDLYSAETQLVKALPKMAKAASFPELRTAFEEHLEQTRQHVERLQQVCELLDTSARGKKCVAMEGLIEEGKELLDMKPEAAVLDAGLIAAAQKVEHYEIAGYGTARTWAEQLGLDEAADLFRQTLDEEKETDERLTELAEQMVNQEAEAGSEDHEEDEEEEMATAAPRKGRGRR